MNLEHEFKMRKNITAAENKGIAIGCIMTFLRDHYLSHGVTLPTDDLREDAKTIFECAKERGVLDEMNVAR